MIPFANHCNMLIKKMIDNGGMIQERNLTLFLGVAVSDRLERYRSTTTPLDNVDFFSINPHSRA